MPRSLKLALFLLVTCLSSLVSAFGQSITSQVPLHYQSNFNPALPMLSILPASGATGHEFSFLNQSGVENCYVDANGNFAPSCVGDPNPLAPTPSYSVYAVVDGLVYTGLDAAVNSINSVYGNQVSAEIEDFVCGDQFNQNEWNVLPHLTVLLHPCSRPYLTSQPQILSFGAHLKGVNNSDTGQATGGVIIQATGGFPAFVASGPAAPTAAFKSSGCSSANFQATHYYWVAETYVNANGETNLINGNNVSTSFTSLGQPTSGQCLGVNSPAASGSAQWYGTYIIDGGTNAAFQTTIDALWSTYDIIGINQTINTVPTGTNPPPGVNMTGAIISLNAHGSLVGHAGINVWGNGPGNIAANVTLENLAVSANDLSGSICVAVGSAQDPPSFMRNIGTVDCGGGNLGGSVGDANYLFEGYDSHVGSDGFVAEHLEIGTSQVTDDYGYYGVHFDQERFPKGLFFADLGFDSCDASCALLYAVEVTAPVNPIGTASASTVSLQGIHIEDTKAGGAIARGIDTNEGILVLHADCNLAIADLVYLSAGAQNSVLELLTPASNSHAVNDTINGYHSPAATAVPFYMPSAPLFAGVSPTLATYTSNPTGDCLSDSTAAGCTATCTGGPPTTACTETAFASTYTIPAGVLVTGVQYRVTVGYKTVAGSTAQPVDIKLRSANASGTTICGFPASTTLASTKSGQAFFMMGGTAAASGSASVNASCTGGLNGGFLGGNTNPAVTLNTTTGFALVPTALFTIGGTANAISITTFTVEELP